MEIKVISPIHQPIKVDKGIPIPEKRTHYSIFPFHEMEKGDSFFVERGRFKKSYFYDLRQFIYQKAKSYCSDTGHQAAFITSIDRSQNGVRCFRIE